MEELKGSKPVHHGQNVRLARTWKKLTQESLADKLNMYQTDISSLEQKETINEELLDRIALAMDVSKDFFTDFNPESILGSYNINNNDSYEMTQTNSDNASGNDNVQQKIIEKQEIINNPIDKVSELYERLLKEKDQLIEILKSRI